MSIVTSKDGTTIAYNQVGEGPALIIVTGALQYRVTDPEMTRLAELLGRHFTVYNYDRRGRGDSSDTQPYAIQREIEDIEALIDRAGGMAFLFGHSSGAVLALKAAAQLGARKIAKLALYEPPFNTGSEEDKQSFALFSEQITELLVAGKHDEALILFLQDMMPPEMLEGMQQSSEWARMKATAPTIAYDNAVLEDGEIPTAIGQSVMIPTLILNGDSSPDFMQEAAHTLADVLPNSYSKTLQNQAHGIASEVVAPVLMAFFNDEGFHS
jgi:pimeloyl-ACP methyl ester carboxylesterase